MNDTDLAFQRVAQHIHSNATLVRHWPLTGGSSAQIEALELELPGQAAMQVVVRRHTSGEWKSHGNDVTAAEFALLTSLYQFGLPVPEPLFLDVSATLLPSPYLVMAMVDGTTDVPASQLPHSLRQLAKFLSHLHSLDIETLALPVLPRLEDPVGGVLKYLPDNDSQVILRAAVATWKTVSNEDSLIHGDFWPGNVLWKDNQIAAVIDWEDTSLGSAVADLACCRCELMVMYDQQAMEVFTRHYLASTKLDVTDLPLWDVYVSASALATMHEWQLPAEVEARRREMTILFLNRAADETIHRVRSAK
jgi:aminoglycoside phosphotransferase (APT) family kinase protein